MAQYEMNLRDYWRIVRRRRLVIIASTILVSAFSLWFTKQKVPVYQATASIRYDQSTSLTGLLVEVLSFSAGNDPIETQATIIKSFPVVEEAARRLGKLPGASAAAGRESKSYIRTVADFLMVFGLTVFGSVLLNIVVVAAAAGPDTITRIGRL